jgi:hypothetical protein
MAMLYHIASRKRDQEDKIGEIKEIGQLSMQR